MSDFFYDFYNFPEGIDTMSDKYRDHAESYKILIDLLLKDQVQEKPLRSERDILPILSFIHHYIELMLKAITLKKGKQFITIHNLKNLLSDIEDLTLSGESNSFIDLLHSLDPEGKGFRYPTDKNMDENFVNDNPTMKKGVSLSTITSGFTHIKKDLEEEYSKE